MLREKNNEIKLFKVLKDKLKNIQDEITSEMTEKINLINQEANQTISFLNKLKENLYDHFLRGELNQNFFEEMQDLLVDENDQKIFKCYILKEDCLSKNKPSRIENKKDKISNANNILERKRAGSLTPKKFNKRANCEKNLTIQKSTNILFSFIKVMPINRDLAENLKKSNVLKKLYKRYTKFTTEYSNNNIEIKAESQDMPEVIDKVQFFCKMMNFDPDPHWNYLHKDGRDHPYAKEINKEIENAYKSNIYELSDDEYENYSINFTYKIADQIYEVQFAKIGGVHRQVCNNKETTTIRVIQRDAKEEIFKKELIHRYSWLWKPINGKFKPYSDSNIFFIEQCYIEWTQNGRKNGKYQGELLIQGEDSKTYEIDFNKMIQIEAAYKNKDLSKISSQNQFKITRESICK